MTAARWHQIREVLYAASQLTGRARAEYLNGQCAGDPALRMEAEKLLSALEQSGGFLERDSAELRGSRIGPYLILGEAGRGGMGIVYHAVRDGDYRQEVAVKLVRAGADTAFLTARFQLERQALALLNHPNIARLLDGGTTREGRPYLVMEWVEGRPITEHCRAHHLDVRERLRLFLNIGDAVEHAHRNLVVHRDLKPSNILITAEGTPKLLDFGVAKIFSAEGVTEPLTMVLGSAPILTPEYASPEQVRGEVVTTATDVYSLGAVLYEVLTGVSRVKLQTRTREEIERVVCSEETLAPSEAVADSGLSARQLRGDLDNIVLKALNKEPSRRYGSVKEFCDDIRNYLEARPVLARKDTLAYRAEKFVRRHRAGAAAAALVLITVLTGAAATLWEARIAVEQRSRAERRFQDVRKLASSFLFEFHDAIEFLPGSTPARALVVKRALEYLDSLAPEARGDASLELEIASAYRRVGELQGDPLFPNLGDVQGALATSRKALAILERMNHADPANPQVTRALALVHRQISGMLSFSGDTAGAVEQSGRALKLYDALSGSVANDPQFQSELASQQYRHADLLRAAGDLDGASAAYRRAIEVCRRLILARPADPEGKIHMAAAVDGLGTLLQDQGDTAGALEERLQGLSLREELARSKPDNAHYRRQLAFSHHNVGLSLEDTGDVSGALSHLETELSLFQSLRAADAKDAQARRNESLAHKQIGHLLLRNGDPKRAAEHYRQSLVLDRERSAADPANSQSLLDLSFSESGFGSALAKLGRANDALPLLRKAIARQELLLQQDSHHILLYGHLANSYTQLADCLFATGDTKTALEFYRKAVAARLTLASKNPASLANRGALAECYSNLGSVLLRTASNDALSQENRAIELLERLTAADKGNARNQARLANALSNAARIYARQASSQPEPARRTEQLSRARSFYERSRDLWSELERAGKLTNEDRLISRTVAQQAAQFD